MAALQNRTVGALLTAAIVSFALATAYIHFTLGGTSTLLGLIFLANVAGYATLAGAVVVAAVVQTSLVRRFSWAPRVALIGFAAMTIVGYLAIGPYSSIGWMTKAIEVVLIGLLVIDVFRVHGNVSGLLSAATSSIFGRADRGSTAA